MMRTNSAIALALVAVVFGAVSCSRDVTPQQAVQKSANEIEQERSRAIVKALASGKPNFYEKAAADNFSASYYRKRTPEDRAEFAKRVFSDFGKLEIGDISANGEDMVVSAQGERGPQVDFIFSFDDTPDRKITGIGVTAGANDGEAEGPPVPPPPLAPSMEAGVMSDALITWLQPYLDHDDFAGVVLVAKNGVPFIEKSFGPADRSTGEPITADTRFNIASIGKKFTQTAIAKLIERQQLSLDTTIGEILPDYPQAETHGATVRQLVDMQAGVSDFFGAEFNAEPKEKFTANHAYYEFVAAMPPRFSPGANTEYCNGCYIVLGEIVEKISGMPFEQFIEENVFKPAGMTHSSYKRPSENAANLYMRSDGPGSPYVDASGIHGVSGSGAGGGYATAGDLLAFDNALRNGVLLNPEMTAFVLGGAPSEGRNKTPMGAAGGAEGTNATLESDGDWTVIITSNISPPLPERIGLAIADAL